MTVTLRNESDLALARTPLDEIIKDYWLLEARIQEAAVMAAIESLPPEVKLTGEHLVIDGKNYFFRVAIGSAKRSLTISALSVRKPKSSLFFEKCALECAGQISNVAVECDDQIAEPLIGVLRALAERLRAQYSMLEIAFLSGYQALEKKQLQGLDTILNFGFSSSNLAPLGNLVHLTVTALSSTDYGFQIGYDQIKFILEKLKRDGTVTISPLEGVIALVSDNSTDSFVRVGILSQQHMSVMGLEKIIELEGLAGLTLAQSALYGSEQLAAVEVCEVRGMSLQASCPASVKEVVMEVVRDVRDDLTQQFQTNVSAWSRRKAELITMLAHSRATKTGAMKAVREFVLEYLARVSAILIRGD